MPINPKDLTPLPWASVGPCEGKDTAGKFLLVSGRATVAVFETEADCDAVAAVMSALAGPLPAVEYTHDRLMALAKVIVAGQSDEMNHFPWIALAQGFLALDAENQARASYTVEQAPGAVPLTV